jgi:uncharacterized Rossmann fold enzyme
MADLSADPERPVALALVEHEMIINTAPDTVLAQVAHNLARGLPELTQVDARASGEDIVALCGSGPSLTEALPELCLLQARGGKVMAFNAAIPALAAAGVPIDYAMVWDASPEMARYGCDVEGCEWLVASRVNPLLVDRLLELGQRVLLWHAAASDAEPELLGLLRGHLMIFGGSTCATRGPFLAGAMGFRDVHMFGVDSSFPAGGETHVGGSLRKEHEIMVVFEGHAYRSTMWMKAQAESWVKFLLPELVPEGMRFTVHGEGLLPAAHRSWERQCGGAQA